MTRAHLKKLRSAVQVAPDRRARGIYFEVYGAYPTIPLEEVRRSVIEAIDELLEMPTKGTGETTMARRNTKKVEAKVEQPVNEPAADEAPPPVHPDNALLRELKKQPLAVLDHVYDGEKCCKAAAPDYTAQLQAIAAGLEALTKAIETESEELRRLQLALAVSFAEPPKVTGAPPKLEVVKTEPPPAPAPAPEPEKPKPVTLDDVRKALLAHVQAKGHEATVAVLAQFNVQRASDLKPEQFAAAKEALTC